MNTFKHFFSYTVFLLISLAGTAQTYKVITVPSPGELENTLGDDWSELDSMVVKGTINKADFVTLYNCSRFGKLTVINLETANIEKNRIPDFALYHPDTTFEYLNIRRIILPGNVTEIGKYAFARTRLQEVNLPASLNKLSDGIFKYCKWLGRDSIIIPEGIREIPPACFYNCRNFRKIILPRSLKEIGSWAFYNTRMEEINLPEGLETIGDHAFYGAEKLKEVVIPGSAANLGMGAFSENYSLCSIKLPEGITEIPYSFLENNQSLDSIIIPHNVTTIHDYAFSGSLGYVQFPDNLKTIGKDAFRRNNITEIVLPASLEYIDQDAFTASDRLEKVYCMATTPPLTVYYFINGGSSRLVFDSQKELTLYVPTGSGELYCNSPFWVDFDKIIETDNFPSSCGITFAPDCSITSSQGFIIINNLTNAPVDAKVYDANGNLVWQEKVTEVGNLNVLPGIYLIKAGNKIHKLIIK